MSKRLKPGKVFTPGSYPVHTYVERDEENHERQLRRRLESPGILISVSGPSKSGKTVLVKRVLGTNLVRVSGSKIDGPEDVWAEALRKLRVPQSVSFQDTDENSSAHEISGGVKGGIPLLSEGQAGAKTGRGKKKAKSKSANMFGAGMDEVVAALLEKGWPLVIDDFHYVERKTQERIAQQLKEALGEGLKVVILAVPHRADDPVRRNKDLQGRITQIDLGFWNKSELERIGELGFPLVGLRVSARAIGKLARESLGSPQLMQALCLATCHYAEDEEREVIKTQQIEPIARQASGFTDARHAYTRLSQGPRAHGVARTQHRMADRSRGDNYVVVLRALAEPPPRTTLNYEEILHRVGQVVPRNPPGGQQIGRTLDQMEIIEEGAGRNRVLEWDNENSVLSVTDPYFLFYVRWRVAQGEA